MKVWVCYWVEPHALLSQLVTKEFPIRLSDGMKDRLQVATILKDDIFSTLEKSMALIK
jgi:hypothetical protein